MDTLESRVATLERENRRWKRGAVLALAVLGGLVLMGQAPRSRVSDEVRTRALVIVDQAGTMRVGLTAASEGPALALFDRAGNARAALCVNKAGTGLTLHDQEGETRASLIVPPDGSPILQLSDKAGNLNLLGATR
jgi:hypothetical protein